MKRIVLAIIVILALVVQADAFSVGNLKFRCPKFMPGCGSDHNKDRQVIPPNRPDTPVSVPEPSTLILLGGGLAALGIRSRFKK